MNPKTHPTTINPTASIHDDKWTEQKSMYSIHSEATTEGIKITLEHRDKSESLSTCVEERIIRLADHVTENKFLDSCRKTKADLEDLSKERAKVDAGREKLKARSKVLLKKLGW